MDERKRIYFNTHIMWITWIGTNKRCVNLYIGVIHTRRPPFFFNFWPPVDTFPVPYNIIVTLLYNLLTSVRTCVVYRRPHFFCVLWIWSVFTWWICILYKLEMAEKFALEIFCRTKSRMSMSTREFITFQLEHQRQLARKLRITSHELKIGL